MKRPAFSTQLVMLWVLVAALYATLVAVALGARFAVGG